MTEHRIEPSIAARLERALPAAYRDAGPLLGRLLRRWAEWAESDGEFLHRSRQLLDYSDIDLVPDELVARFATKYLPDVVATDATVARLLVRHALTLFRARGTPVGIDLYMRLAHGTGAEVYYPWRDVFRPSDGRWNLPKYVEVSPRANLRLLKQSTVQGLQSGARAFVERVVRKRGPTSRYVSLLLVSRIEGTFVIGEALDVVGAPLANEDRPFVVGSAATIDVAEADAGFAVGDRVHVHGSRGWGSEATVLTVKAATDTVDFALGYGGWGYTVNADAITSEQVLTGRITSNTGWTSVDSYYALYDVLTQPLAHALVNAATTVGVFASNDSVFAYNGASALVANGIVVESESGSLFVYRTAGSFATANVIGTAANVKHANVLSQTNVTATANVIGEGRRLELVLSSLFVPFQVGETVLGTLDCGGIVVSSSANSVTGVGSLIVDDHVGQCVAGEVLTGQSSGVTGVIDSISLRVGVVDVINDFFAHPLAPVRSAVSNAWIVIDRVSPGTGAGFSWLGLEDTETASVSFDYLTTHAAETIAPPGFPTGGLSSVIDLALTYVAVEIGSVASIVNLMGGAGYTEAPIARIVDDTLLVFRKADWIIGFSGATGGFSVGETVSQASTGARGIVRALGADQMTVRRRSWGDFQLSVYQSQIAGENGALADVVSVEADSLGDVALSRDVLGRYMGADAVVETSVQSVPGVIKTLRLRESGYGYVDQEFVTLTNPGSTTAVGQGFVSLGSVGTGAGRWTRRGGQPDAGKKIRDSVYWQQYSYDVKTGVPLDQYEDALKRVFHVAGTRAFGTMRHQREVASTLDRTRITVTQS